MPLMPVSVDNIDTNNYERGGLDLNMDGFRSLLVRANEVKYVTFPITDLCSHSQRSELPPLRAASPE